MIFRSVLKISVDIHIPEKKISFWVCVKTTTKKKKQQLLLLHLLLQLSKVIDGNFSANGGYCPWNGAQRLGKNTGNQKNQDHFDHSIGKIG